MMMAMVIMVMTTGMMMVKTGMIMMTTGMMMMKRVILFQFCMEGKCPECSFSSDCPGSRVIFFIIIMITISMMMIIIMIMVKIMITIVIKLMMMIIIFKICFSPAVTISAIAMSAGSTPTVLDLG